MKQICIALSLVLFMVLAVALSASAQSSAQVPANFLQKARSLHPAGKVSPKPFGLNFSGSNSSGIPGIDSIPNFVKSFNANGQDAFGNPQNVWSYAMVGRAPEKGDATFIPAPIIPVSVNLLNPDGSVFLHYDVKPFVLPTLLSPVFFPNKWSTSKVPTQYTDAVQRAEFFNHMEDDWHTLLIPELKKGLTMSIPSGSYFYALNNDGSCCLFVLADIDEFISLLFPPTFPVDNTTVIGAAELNGSMTTKDITTLLFPNTYLYFNGDPNQCCVLGFHEFDFEPGIPQNGNLPRLYVMNYSSYISPGLFGGGFQDITALSHEMSETFNDPFVVFDGVHNLTPWWFSGGNCQDDLEDGDVIEGLPDNVVFPIKSAGRVYHPQNEALLQWFEFKSPSDAFQHAYSYPNTQTLTALSPALAAGCTGPLP
ncbi:MAG TPA: hypothetical protein VEU52_04555 [Candidatus Limnocylindrales bacterium]|nr:hypothetical protein [Candidatus Limnocylindrales bacterium]